MIDAVDPQPYATQRAAELRLSTPDLSWLIDQLFLCGGAGILGGPPKSCKSFLALEIAVAVASGTPVGGRFATAAPVPALVLGAEDPPGLLVRRLEALARSRGLRLDDLPIHVIVETGVRLPAGSARLASTVTATGARLVVLDPLIRLHTSDENSATEMSAILDGLRSVARTSNTAILVVHHTRKAAAGSSPGHSLRGSSDLHAFGDTNLYLRRLERPHQLELRIEHRAWASLDPLCLHLHIDQQPDFIARFSFGDPIHHDPLQERALALLQASLTPLTARAIRDALRVRNQDVVRLLHDLARQRRIERMGRQGWVASKPATVPVPSPCVGNAGTVLARPIQLCLDLDPRPSQDPARRSGTPHLQAGATIPGRLTIDSGHPPEPPTATRVCRARRLSSTRTTHRRKKS